MRWSTRKQGDDAQRQGDKRQRGNWSITPPSTLRPSPSSDAGTVLLGATGRAGEKRRGRERGRERQQLVEAQDGEME